MSIKDDVTKSNGIIPDRFKTRAWHKEEQRLMQVASLDYNPQKIWVMESIEGIDDSDTLIGYQFYEVILMQCTGLRDKNGVLIFEGDIVQNGHSNYLVEIHPQRKNFYAHSRRPYYLQFDLWKLNTPKIIGNIHQNPELLEVGDV